MMPHDVQIYIPVWSVTHAQKPAVNEYGDVSKGSSYRLQFNLRLCLQAYFAYESSNGFRTSVPSLLNNMISTRISSSGSQSQANRKRDVMLMAV